MAVRGVFIPKDHYPYFEEVFVEFDWFGGFAKAQKQRNVLSLHMNFTAAYPDMKHIEISSGSMDKLGTKLSAMNLKKFSRTLERDTSVEAAFQSSRIYIDEDGSQIGPFPQYLGLDGRECKKAVREASKGLISYTYNFEDMVFPAPKFHISLFYDWVYMNGLLEDSNREVHEELLSGEYDAFSDLATKSLNSQARSCALFVSLHSLGLLDKIKDYDSYMELFRVDVNAPKLEYAAKGAWNDVQSLQKNGAYKPLRPTAPKVFDKEAVKQQYDAVI